MDKFDIFAMLKIKTREEKQRLREQIGQEKDQEEDNYVDGWGEKV